MYLLPFDTETSAIPEWKMPSDDPCQPHLVELAALLVDPMTYETIESMDVIIRPDGWEWDETSEAFQKHGITMEQAMDEGIPEEVAVDQFLSLYEQGVLRIAHNTTFDNRIMRIAMKRHRPGAVPDEKWKDKSSYYCTMINHRKAHGGKQPSLAEAFEFHTGMTLEGAHRAMVDTRACLDVYKGLMRHEQRAASVA